MNQEHALRALGRPLSRFRWIKKTKSVARWSGFHDRAWHSLCFILADPDVNTYSYKLANQFQLATAVAQLLGREPSAAQHFAAELAADEPFVRYLRDQSRWRPQAKRNPPLGRHVASYLVVRIIKPETVTEFGVKHGLGSAVILRGLERNRDEGSPGSLLSVDPDPAAGWFVTKQRFPDWQLFKDTSNHALPGILAGRLVGLSISDSVADPATTRREITETFRHAGPEYVAIGNRSWNQEILDFSERVGGASVVLLEKPANHPYPGREVAIAYVNSRASAT